MPNMGRSRAEKDFVRKLVLVCNILGKYLNTIYIFGMCQIWAGPGSRRTRASFGGIVRKLLVASCDIWERRQIKVWLFPAKLFTGNVGAAALRLDYLITSWNQQPICQNQQPTLPPIAIV